MLRRLVLVSAMLALGAPTCVTAAPPSSAMSNPELAPPQIQPKSQQVTTLYKCTGYYNTFDCTTRLLLNDCKHSIVIYWAPLLLPGTLEWARTHRTWCSVTYDGAEQKEEHKLEPEKCDGLMRLLAAGFQGFPEVKWQDANCNVHQGPDGLLYESQHYRAPLHPDFLHVPLKDPDPEPMAVRLEDVRTCELHNPPKQKRVLRCQVLPQEVHSYLRKLLGFLEVGIAIRNPVR